ncbi:MAG: phenylacetate--CoA ligase family protein [Steroidobacteraceae bacterium]|jgi:phenylacetate-CoA ligase
MVSYTFTLGAAAGDPAPAWPEYLGSATTLRPLLDGLASSQRLGGEQLRSGQARALAALATWSSAHVGPYAEQQPVAAELVAAVANPVQFFERWQRWPVLSKADLRLHGAAMHAAALPAHHLPLELLRTSGSTGIPVEVATTPLTRRIWSALTAREHLWQLRDPGRRLGIIRYRPKTHRNARGEDLPSWGPPMAELVPTGPASVIHVGYSVDLLAEWLARFDPHYLLTYPSVAAALLEMLPSRGARLPSLEEVRLISEPLDPELEARLRADWGVRVTDMYSANEVGHIAFRCREFGQLHVQAESLLVEILDERGAPCAVGMPGRVVVTALHNLATPLLRYELGDLASFGPPCGCGRGLPVLERVLGRVRNLVRTPDGRRHWPLGLVTIRAVTAITQAQYVQRADGSIEVRVVLVRPLSQAEEQQAIDLVRRALGYPFEVLITPVAAIERGPGGKFEEFLSLLDQ